MQLKIILTGEITAQKEDTQQQYVNKEDIRYLSAKISTLRREKWRYCKKMNIFSIKVRNVGYKLPRENYRL